MGPWERVHKGDDRARRLADDHYTRQSPGHPMWTRPGYNHVLFCETGPAVFCWWRPKWEHGTPGTSRKDGLRVIECTMFRRVGDAPVASVLILAAVVALSSADAAKDLRLDTAGPIDMLITGVNGPKTRRGRSPHHKPGRCYRAAGWRELDKSTRRAPTWLWFPWSNPL